MDKTTLDFLNIKYDSLSKQQKRIADWLRDNPGEILSLSISELAERCQGSEATIVRFAQKLGFSGYQELKISLAQENNTTSVSTTVDEKDSVEEIYDKVCNEIYCSLEKTKMVLDNAALEAAGEKIIAAERIVIFGLGNSASIAKDMEHKLLRAGCNAVAYSDNHMQVIAASHLSKGDVAVAISHSGSSKDIVEALRIAKEKGATTVTITNQGKSPIIKCSDHLLCTASDETKHNILALNSRIAQLSIINTLYYYVAYRHGAVDAIRETERSLLSKKY